MKIFLSHSSRYKPLIRELKNHLPQHITAWLDEKDILVGDEIEKTIKDAIETSTDFVILFVDEHSVKSKWVRQELMWALEHEAKTARTFVLPVVLDEKAWNGMEPAAFKARKYIKCTDFTEDAIKGLANSLIAQSFAWLSRDLALAKSAQPLDTSRNLLEEADRYLVEVANEVRFIASAYDRSNPLPLAKLYEMLQRRKISEC